MSQTCINSGRYLEAGGFSVGVVVDFGEEGGSEGGFVELVELVVDESQQQTALSDAAIPDDDDLDMSLVLIHCVIDLL